MVNRKLVRPNLAEIKERLATQSHVAHEPPYRDTSGNGATRRRPVPPEGTAAEATTETETTAAPATLPTTGGVLFPIQGLVLALGAASVGAGVVLHRRKS